MLRYGKFLSIFIILLCIFIVYPFITSFVYMGTRFFGEPVSYLAGGIVGNLYVPLLAVLGTMLIFIVIKFVYVNLFINKKLLNVEMNNVKVKQPNIRLREGLVILALVVGSIVIVFNSLMTEWNLIQDIPHLVHSDFSVEEGRITLYEVSHGDVSETLMIINGIRMSGGISYNKELLDNAKYYVEYLPHSKYVVRYHRIY